VGGNAKILGGILQVAEFVRHSGILQGIHFEFTKDVDISAFHICANSQCQQINQKS